MANCTTGEGGHPPSPPYLPWLFTVPANLSARLCTLALSLLLIAFALPALAGPFEDAVAKCRAGLTTIDEVFRVTASL